MAKPKRILKSKYGLREQLDLNAPAPKVEAAPVIGPTVEERIAAQLSSLNVRHSKKMEALYEEQRLMRQRMEEASTEFENEFTVMKNSIVSDLKGLFKAALPEWARQPFNVITSAGNVVTVKPETADINIYAYCEDYQPLFARRRDYTSRYDSVGNKVYPIPETTIGRIMTALCLGGVSTIGEDFTFAPSSSDLQDHDRFLTAYTQWLSASSQQVVNNIRALTREAACRSNNWEVTDYEAGMHYPLKKNIKGWLRALGINARNDSRDISYDTCAYGEEGDPVKAFSVVGPAPNATGADLREYVRFNQNMVKVETYLTERGLLDKRVDTENTRGTFVKFHLKMVKPRGTAKEAGR